MILEINSKTQTDDGKNYADLTQNDMFNLLQFSIFRATTGKIKKDKFMVVMEQIVSYLHAKGAL